MLDDPPRLLLTVMFCGFAGQENWPVYLPPPLFVSVPINWFVEVWGRGVPILMERFVVAVLSSTPDRLSLMTVNTALTEPRTLTVELE